MSANSCQLFPKVLAGLHEQDPIIRCGLSLRCKCDLNFYNVHLSRLPFLLSVLNILKQGVYSYKLMQDAQVYM